MTLYVDNVKIPAGVHNQWTGRTVRGKWCHLISDLLDPELELHPFAVEVLGLKIVYFQRGTGIHGEYCPGHDHYDLIESKRALAIRHGAVPISAQELGQITIKKTQLWRAMVAARAERIKMNKKPKPLRCYHGVGTDAELDELVKQERLTPCDADAIRDFREFLRSQAQTKGQPEKP